MNNTTLITTENNWLEQTAINQFYAVSKLPGVEQAVALPDLHAGKTPIGIAIVTRGILYPHLMGGDIGCGIALYKTGIERRKLKAERWESRLNHIRALSDLETVNPFDEESPIFDLGTLGGGNHFAEFQLLNEVRNEAEFSKLGISDNDVFLSVHCGSRGYGQAILSEFNNPAGYPSDSAEAIAYLEKHADALLWAKRNRFLVAEKLIAQLGFDAVPASILDCSHNFLEVSGEKLIHRKGAVSSKGGFVLLPGSRGTMTYLIKPSQDTQISADSLSHGAGRKWARSLCKSRIRDKYDRDTIRQTKLKSRVVCHDTELLYEEAPEAYKNIGDIIDSLQTFGLIEVIATFTPILTYKG